MNRLWDTERLLPKDQLKVHRDAKMKNESSYFDCVNGEVRAEGQRMVFDLPSARDTRE